MNAIVTGATKGIGRAIVNQLAANKYNVALCSRNEDQLGVFVEELEMKYREQQFYGMKADMRVSRDVETFAEFAERSLGQVDVLINNAGLYMPGRVGDQSLSDLKSQMEVNVYAPFSLCQHLTRGMVKRGKGHIINICSVAGIKEVRDAAAYSVSKAALLSLTKLLRQEYQDLGIKVSVILPGSTLTDSWAGTTLPADRFVQAEDIASAVITCLQMSPGANVDEIIIRPQKGDI